VYVPVPPVGVEPVMMSGSALAQKVVIGVLIVLLPIPEFEIVITTGLLVSVQPPDVTILLK
jgi:hypothetical protein